MFSSTRMEVIEVNEEDFKKRLTHDVASALRAESCLEEIAWQLKRIADAVASR